MHLGNSSWNHEIHETHERRRRCQGDPFHRAGEVGRRVQRGIPPYFFVYFVYFVVHLNCRSKVYSTVTAMRNGAAVVVILDTKSKLTTSSSGRGFSQVL